MLKDYYRLTKPGIIYGNVLTALAGFLLASKGVVNDWRLLASLLLGLSLVIGAACVYNNVLDRNIDKKMKRTRHRALVTGRISPAHALVYGTGLGVGGFAVLITGTNWLTVALGVFALFFYVVVYGIVKRASVHGTLIGAIPGAVPPVAGYVAVTGHLDLAAWLLFVILVMWQMPHFYAIAIYRKKEYEAAGLPVLSVKYGVDTAKQQIFWYIVAFIVATLLLSYAGYTGITFAIVMLLVGFLWLRRSRRGATVKDSDTWARGMFGFSLKVLLLLCLLLSVEAWLP